MGKNGCKACGRCCMVFEIGPLTQEEISSGCYRMYEDHLFSGDFYLEKCMPDWVPDWAKQGICVYLGSDMKCSIYDERPSVCRGFVCLKNGKIDKRYRRARRCVSNPDKWTEYEKKAFGKFLKKSKRGT